ncbi:hypothetical protein FVER14953_20050 [Fusarium verticillioides]|nr:hypothetical protein FVER14953_20050 [Fusarium verticillioides]
MGEELTALSVFKNEVELLLVLEGIEQLDNKWMPVDGLKNLSLSLGLLNELLVDDKRGLFELLLSVESPSRALLDEQYSTIGTLAKTSQLFKVLRRHLTVWRKAAL